MLRDTFLAVRPRETAGPLSSDRFAYQRDWALCHLLKLHSDTADYLIVFDLHDDVLVFDSETNPTFVSFYQVKSRSTARSWTRTELLKRQIGKAGPKLSILGKLYSNKLSFPANTKDLTFVSNMRITMALADGTESTSRSSFRSVDLSPDVRSQIADSLSKECGECTETDLDAHLAFEVADLSLDDHEGHTRGKLSEFLERIQPDGHRTVKVGLVYRTLKDEITRRNNAASVALQTFDDLPKIKGFGRSGFQSLLANAGLLADLPDAWAEFQQRLNTEQMPYARVMRLKRHWATVEAQRLNTDNLALQELTQRVDEALGVVNAHDSERLTDLMEAVLERVGQYTDAPMEFRDDDVRVLAMMRSYEAELPAAGSSSPKAKT